MRFIDTSRIRTRFDERVLANDGNELSVDIYFPPAQGSYPVLFQRTPADNNRAGRVGISDAPAERWKRLAAQGYIVATGDVRGRGDSDGIFTPFINESEDGATTIAWLRNLDEANGKVGLFGSGYSAFCAWAAACADKNIDAIVSLSPFGAVGEGLVHNGGAVRLDWLFWMHLIGGRTVQPANVPNWSSIYKHLPLNTMDEVLGRSDIWWKDWLSHLDPNDLYWEPLNLNKSIAQLNTPALHVTGWWDGQLAGARYYHQAAVQSTAPQHLIIGPWDTAGVRRPQQRTGGFDFGPSSVLDMDEELGYFFDEYLKNHTPTKPRPKAKLFTTGRNEWLESEGWPTTPPKQSDEWFLSSTMGANTRRGDGCLTAEILKDNTVDTITHNPDIPVLHQSGFVGFGGGVHEFSLDQTPITARDEALVYTSESMPETITGSGRTSITLTLKTNAPDADIFVLLSDVFPGGTRDLHLSHAAHRLSTSNGFKSGELSKVELSLSDVNHDFLVGHQLRITVTPSLFPLYARNPQGHKYLSADTCHMSSIEIIDSECVITIGKPNLL